jgi:Holliday junction DNA helicase RuvB
MLIRPTRFSEFIGQDSLLVPLKVAVDACKETGEPVTHILCGGAPGLGKSSIAHVIAGEMGTPLYVINAVSFNGVSTLMGFVGRRDSIKNSVILIDEGHRLPVGAEELLCTALEEFAISIPGAVMTNGRVSQIKLKPFTCVLATTHAGRLSPAFRNRFGISIFLDFYKENELSEIVINENPAIEKGVAYEIARRSRGCPRTAISLLHRIEEYSVVNRTSVCDLESSVLVFKSLGITSEGLNQLDIKYLLAILEQFGGGPVGGATLAGAIFEDTSSLEDVIEPFLLVMGYIEKTSRGRVLTSKGIQALVKENITALDITV